MKVPGTPGEHVLIGTRYQYANHRSIKLKTQSTTCSGFDKSLKGEDVACGSKMELSSFIQYMGQWECAENGMISKIKSMHSAANLQVNLTPRLTIFRVLVFSTPINSNLVLLSVYRVHLNFSN